MRETIMRLAERDGLDVVTRERLSRSLGVLEKYFDGLGFCLSEEGDLLSQWRGYADDARGVSIGFSKQYLEKLVEKKEVGKHNLSLIRVEYDTQAHEAHLKPTYLELRDLINKGAFKFRGAQSLLDSRTPEEIARDDEQIGRLSATLSAHVIGLFTRLFELKTPAFREEKEWRLVSSQAFGLADDSLYRSGRNRVVPYRSFDIAELDVASVIEIILGPKHRTPPKLVQLMLKAGGFGDVSVRHSNASYR